MLMIPTKLQLIKSLTLPIIDYMDVVYAPYESRRKTKDYIILYLILISVSLIWNKLNGEQMSIKSNKQFNTNIKKKLKNM